MPRTKNHSRKKARTEDPPSSSSFTQDRFRDRYKKLKKKKFGVIRTIDWDVLRTLHLDTQIEGYINRNGWSKVFEISEPAFKELTLEVLSTIDYDSSKVRMQQPGAVRFQAFGEQQVMSTGQLAVLMGYYDEDFLTTMDFTALDTGLPAGLIADMYWRDITDGADSYNKKATKIKDPGHRYLQILTSRSICGRSDSTGVCSRADLVVMHSMISGRPFHLGHLIADFLQHQGQMLRSTAIYAGPWITQLIRGMGLIERTAGMEIVGGISPITMANLRQIRLVSFQSGKCIIVKVGDNGEEVAASDSGTEHSVDEGDEDDEATPAAAPTSAPPDPQRRSTSLRAQVAELAAAVARLEENQLSENVERQIRETQILQQQREILEQQREIRELLHGRERRVSPSLGTPSTSPAPATTVDVPTAVQDSDPLLTSPVAVQQTDLEH